MSKLTDSFDPTRPTNSVEAAAKYIGVSRGLAYRQARSSAWPALRVGSRLLIRTRDFMRMIDEMGVDDASPVEERSATTGKRCCDAD